MIPGIKASFFLDPVTTYYCGQLLEYGAKVYKYRGYVHAKTIVIDDEICCIGSVNMDMRSLMVDDEVCGVFYSSPLVKQYIDIFKADIQNCDAYSWQRFLDRGRKEKALASFFVLFAPLMWAMCYKRYFNENGKRALLLQWAAGDWGTGCILWFICQALIWDCLDKPYEVSG